MPEGTFGEFLDALRAFESGWDRLRYEQGIIADWQLDQWAGGPVEAFFPEYGSWGELTDAEWTAMSYRSMNTLGFVGYQFGEALLIDLGYYDDDFYYGNGAASNTWDGTWTGKNGATSLEAFMTEEVQEQAIRDAFGHNLQIIEAGLAQNGLSLDAFLGTTGTYTSGGETVSVELTLTGILAAAHLRGAPATVTLLLNGAVSADEFGTSILQYIAQFGGYDAPPIEQLIADFEAGKTGDEGLGGPGGGVAGGGGTAGVTAETADVVITWNWGADTVVSDFDPASSTIFIDWIAADSLEVREAGGAVVFSVPSNAQTTTLSGVSLSDLSPANFTILDTSAADEVLALIGAGGDSGGGSGGGDSGGGSGDGGSGDGDSGGGDGGSGDGSGNGGGGGGSVGGDVTAETADVVIDWAWGTHAVVNDFDPASATVFIGWIGADRLEVTETSEGVVFAVPSNQQTTTLAGVGLADLIPANFTIRDATAADEVFALIGAGGVPDGDSGGGDGGDGDGDTDGDEGDGGSGDGGSSDGGSNGDGPIDGDAPQVVSITWDWAAKLVISDFDPATDRIDFGSVTGPQLAVSAAADGDVVIEVLGNGGHTYRFDGVTAEDLGPANLTAPSWNSDTVDAVLEDLSALV